MTPDRRLPPLNRRTDPPEKLARLQVALAPWRDLINFAVLIGGLAYIVARSLGFGVITAEDEIAALRAEIEAERAAREAADAASMQDRAELRVTQLRNTQRSEEILLVVCSLLPEAEARRNYACSRTRVGGVTFALPQGTPVSSGPEMPPIPTRPTHTVAAALLPGKRWASRLMWRHDDRIPDPYPEV